MNDFAHPLAAGLLGGAPRPEDDDVLAEGVHHLLVTTLKALADSDHEDDRSNSPRDSKHRQCAPEFVRPYVPHRLSENLAGKRHGSTSCSPSVRPSKISVR